LADEPTGNLDSRRSLEIVATLQRLNQERGLTVVVVTHEPDIAAFAGRILQCRDGRIVADRPVPAPRDAGAEAAALPPEEAP
jgi:putative ABC transport system ATP-binding protein